MKNDRTQVKAGKIWEMSDPIIPSRWSMGWDMGGGGFDPISFERDGTNIGIGPTRGMGYFWEQLVGWDFFGISQRQIKKILRIE